jgi:hypothetical protein
MVSPIPDDAPLEWLPLVRDVLATGQPAVTKPAAYLTVRLDDGMLERLRAGARLNGRTVESLALELLRKGLGR